MNWYHIGASTLGFQACHNFVDDIRYTIHQQKKKPIIQRLVITCSVQISQLLISSSNQKATAIVLCELKTCTCAW